jgi:hypothetical protein
MRQVPFHPGALDIALTNAITRLLAKTVESHLATSGAAASTFKALEGLAQMPFAPRGQAVKSDSKSVLATGYTADLCQHKRSS